MFQSTSISKSISNQMCLNSILNKMGRSVSMHTDQSTDYGPHRFCKHCGISLEDVYEEQDSNAIWMHPETDCRVVGVVDSDDMVSGIGNHEHLTMDNLRDAYYGIRKSDWYHAHAKELKELYRTCADDAGVDNDKECCEFKTEVNDDEGNVIVNETEASDIGISCEEHTHESIERLKFWRLMSWMIGHCPDRAYDMAINKMAEDPDEDIIQEDEAIWINGITNGMRNPGMVRYGQFRAMEAKKYLKNNPLTFIPRKEIPKFENFEYKEEEARVKKYGKIQVLSFDYYGQHIIIKKGKTATNWLTYLDNNTLNEVLDWARKEYKK